jgi:hypothetical protein
MVVFCPGCGSKISVQPPTPGGDVSCPRCHSTFATAGIKEATDAPPPKRFKPKKTGRSKLGALPIVLAVLLLLAGGIAALWFFGWLPHWTGAPTDLLSSGQPTWQEYSNTEGRFRVLFPGTPTREAIMPSGRSEAAAKPLAVSFTVETPDAHYAVAFEDVDTRTRSAEQLMEQHHAEATSGKVGRLAGERDVTVGSHKGKEFTIHLTSGGTAHIRYVAASSRLYKLTVLGRSKPPEPATVEKFFESFDVTG